MSDKPNFYRDFPAFLAGYYYGSYGVGGYPRDMFDSWHYKGRPSRGGDATGGPDYWYGRVESPNRYNLCFPEMRRIEQLEQALAGVHASIDAMCCLDEDLRDAACRAAGHEPCGEAQTSYVARSHDDRA